MSMMGRHYTWRGVRRAAGVLIDEERLGTPVARRRVLAAWEAGARCYRCDAGILLVWSTPRMLDARYAPGALVLRHGEAFTSVPVDPQVPGPGPGELVRARHGEVSSVPLNDALAAAGSSDFASARAAFERRWVVANLVRAVLHCAGFATIVVGIVVGNSV